MQGDQTEQKIFPSRNQFVNCNISTPSKQMGCCNTITKSLIVTTINPISRSRPVHPGTKNFTICSLKNKENIIFAHNYFRKTQTNQATCCLDFQSSIFFLLLGLDTLFLLQSILTLIV